MTYRSFIIIFAAATTVTSAKITVPPTAGGTPMPFLSGKKKAPTTQKNVLAIRGGAGPLDVNEVAKFSTAIGAINAGFVTLAPKKADELYGTIEVTPMFEWLTQASGVTIAACAVRAWCLFFGGTSINKAVGAGHIPWIIFSLSNLLSDKPKELGVPAFGQYIVLATSMFCAHALLTDASYSEIVMKGYAIWMIANGLFLWLSPGIGSKSWGVEGDDALIFLLSMIGSYCVSTGLLIGSLAIGIDKTKALGYAWIPILLNLIQTNFITKEVDKFKMRKGPQYLWIFLCAIFVGTLAI